ncbi:MAG: MASE3 domain-containing protein [bacterium]
MRKARRRIPNAYVTVTLGMITLSGLYLTSLHSYLLFHSLAELFSVIIACSIFLLAWNSSHFMGNHYLLFIGIASLFVGSLDIVHTLAYKGLGIFQGHEANLPTQLWLAARYVQSLTLCLAPIFLRRKCRPRLILLGYAAITSLLLASVLYWRIFPDCYLEGVGLTSFKIISEYLISLILVVSIAILYRYRSAFDHGVFRSLVISIIALIAAELAFTAYIGIYDLANCIGHLFKIISFYFLYQAIVVTGLMHPYELLFRSLKEHETRLQEAHDVLERRVEERTAEISKVNRELVHAYEDTLEGWILALDMRDKETENHTQRVTEITLSLARYMNFNREELVNVRRGALLHDIGKIGIPDSILHKPGPLTPEEWEIMRQHPVHAYNMLSPIFYLRPALDIPYEHHERWDGSGYPRGLKGEQIPPAVRIFSVVDVWDALSSDRPYRKGWPEHKVTEYICRQAGSHFDPTVVAAFQKFECRFRGHHP